MVSTPLETSSGAAKTALSPGKIFLHSVGVPAAAGTSYASERAEKARCSRGDSAVVTTESSGIAALGGGTTDDDSAEEEQRVGGRDILVDPVYGPHPRYEFPREWRGPPLIPPSKVLEGVEVMRSLLGSTIFSHEWAPLRETDDIGALGPVGFSSLEELVRTAPMSLLVDKLSLFGLACIDDVEVAMSVLPNTTVCLLSFYITATWSLILLPYVEPMK
jgi:hypothetical protein